MSNLNQLFSSVKIIYAPKTVKLLDGRLTVFKRPNSYQWQCRFKLVNGRWHSASTGTEDISQAKQQAISIYETVKIRTEAGLATSTRSFKQLAGEEITRMARTATTPRTERKYKDYLFILEKYLIPFFGNFDVAKIDDEAVADFEAWRLAEMGKNAKQMTKKHHAMAYNRVMTLAKARGYIPLNKMIVPLDITGERGKSRPAFTFEELEQLYAYMPQWQVDVWHKQSTEIRYLCCAYVKFLVNTGIRHSTESMPLRWKHLQWHFIGSKRYLRIWVSGKTGARYLIAKNAVLEVLEDLMRWHKLPFADLNQLIQAKLDRRMFTLQSGEMPHLMENIFRNLMNKSGLMKDAGGQNRTLYSLRHTYATLALADGIDIHTLAKQMGTSVVMIERHYSKLTAMMSAEKLA
jgi:integrase